MEGVVALKKACPEPVEGGIQGVVKGGLNDG